MKEPEEVRKELGASVLEYTILIALVVLVVVGAMTALGRQINSTLPDGVPQPSTSFPLPTTTVPCPTTTTSSTTTSTTSTTPTTPPTPPGC